MKDPKLRNTLFSEIVPEKVLVDFFHLLKYPKDILNLMDDHVGPISFDFMDVHIGSHSPILYDLKTYNEHLSMFFESKEKLDFEDLPDNERMSAIIWEHYLMLCMHFPNNGIGISYDGKYTFFKVSVPKSVIDLGLERFKDLKDKNPESSLIVFEDRSDSCRDNAYLVVFSLPLNLGKDTSYFIKYEF